MSTVTVEKQNSAMSNAFKAVAVLWVVWGVVHMFFGVATMAVDTSEGFANIAAGVESDALEADYHPAVGAILNQHGWNLLWFGIVTTIGGFMVWRASMTAVWVSAMVGGLADVGYLTFVDFGGHGTFAPGTLMTLIAGAACPLSVWIWNEQRSVAS